MNPLYLHSWRHIFIANFGNDTVEYTSHRQQLCSQLSILLDIHTTTHSQGSAGLSFPSFHLSPHQKEKKAVHSLSAVMFSLSLLSRFCPVHPKTAQWGLRLESVPATPCFQAYHLVLYSWFWHSLDLFFGSLSFCRMTNPWSTRPEAVAWRRIRLW